MQKLLIYVQKSDSFSEIMKFIKSQFGSKNITIDLIAIIDLHEIQTAFLSLNQTIINDHRKNAELLLKECLNIAKKSYITSTHIIEGDVNSSILQYIRENNINYLVVTAMQEKERRFTHNLSSHKLNVPITILPV